MYIDGIFDSPEVEVLSDDLLPRDATVLYRYEDIGRFLSSTKDLAVFSVNYPAAYSEDLAHWLEQTESELHEACSFQQVQTRLSSSAVKLIEPFHKIMTELDRLLQGQCFDVTIKAIRDQMCPLFHVDNLKLRLITTLQGPGTQWLSDADALRKNLGKAGRKPIAKKGCALQELKSRQVALVKGAKFPGSKGLIHRSPPVDPRANEPRIFLRLDYF